MGGYGGLRGDVEKHSGGGSIQMQGGKQYRVHNRQRTGGGRPNKDGRPKWVGEVTGKTEVVKNGRSQTI